MIATAYNDEILEPAGHVQMTVVDESEVAGFEHTLPVGACDTCIEGGVRFFLPAPVSLSDTLAFDENFADLSIGASSAGFWLYDIEGLIEPCFSAAYERSCVIVVFVGRRHSILFEFGGFDMLDSHRGKLIVGRDEKGSFCEAVTGSETRLGEARRAKKR